MPLFTRLRGIGILRTSRSRSSQKFAPRNSHLAYENSPYGANLATKCATYSGTKAVGEPGLAAKPLPWVGCEGYSGKPLATALGLLRTGEEGKDVLVHPTERRLRGDVAAALEDLGQGCDPCTARDLLRDGGHVRGLAGRPRRLRPLRGALRLGLPRRGADLAGAPVRARHRRYAGATHGHPTARPWLCGRPGAAHRGRLPRRICSGRPLGG